jgi:hypothetical protein
MHRQFIDERRFARAGRAGDADDERATGVRENGFHQFRRAADAVFGFRNRPRDRARFPIKELFDQILGLEHKFVIFSLFPKIFQKPPPVLVRFKTNGVIDFNATAKLFRRFVFLFAVGFVRLNNWKI